MNSTNELPVPDADALAHSERMAAHIRAVLTDNSINIPVTDGNLALGTWQGLYLWEHRLAPHTRRLIVTVNGEA